MIADFKKSDLLKKAYKKLKSSVYFDKTNLVLRDKLVQFESSQKNLDSVLDALWNAFLSDDEIWNQYIENILQDIRCIALPKKLYSGTEKGKASDDATVEQSSGKRPRHPFSILRWLISLAGTTTIPKSEPESYHQMQQQIRRVFGAFAVLEPRI